MTDRHLRRLAAAAEGAGAAGFAAVMVAPSPDLAYLTGYDPPPFERLTLLVVRPGSPPVLIVPELEKALALECPVGAELEILAWTDGDDPYEAAAALLPGEGRIAVGDRMVASHLLGLQWQRPKVGFLPASSVIWRLRAVKDDEELAVLARAGRGADETFRQVCRLGFEGRREEEIAADLARLLVENGHGRAAFTIVASGPNGASPHHEPGGRTIRAKDAVVMDFGGELGGYFSDTTRTVVVKEPPDGFAEIYDLVQEAQEAAFRAVKPRAAAQDVDRAARDPIADAGHGDRFFHRTGHGIGREVHEPPYIVEGSATTLEPGMTFSIEPGIYLEGRFGVRIEDIVTVVEDGAERLNRSTRELQIVP
ncbi:MAG TPA: Xaa-Pro peptidase family protein [Actinomycetota bacterium]|nr:Xaa-Pro peptidase family protein [Actinomycetota bacterium]